MSDWREARKTAMLAKILDEIGQVQFDQIMHRYGAAGPPKACGLLACGWVSGDGTKFVKLTADAEDAYTAEMIRGTSKYADILVRVHEVKVMPRSGSRKRDQLYLIVTDRVTPVDGNGVLGEGLDWVQMKYEDRTSMGPRPAMAAINDYYDELVAAHPAKPERAGAERLVLAKFTRLAEVSDALGSLDLLYDAHSGNWGLRVPGDQTSLVLFDFGRSHARKVDLEKFKNPSLSVKKGKVFADGVDLQKAVAKVRDKNLVLVGPFVPAFLFGENRHILYLARTEDGAYALGEAAQHGDDKNLPPIFPDRAQFGGPGTLAALWKFPLARKHLVAAVQFHALKDRIVVTHMIVKESFRRNKINSLMMDYIREVFPGRELEFKDPTIDGSAFMKGYGK